MSDLEDDDVPQLSSHALAALQEFYAEQKQHTNPGGGEKYNVGRIEENWQLSQFWYSQETALRLAEEAIAAAGEGGSVRALDATSLLIGVFSILRRCAVTLQESEMGASVVLAAVPAPRVACVSAPTVYQKLRELRGEDLAVYVFEYDRRFAVYGEEFVFYDYNNPLDLPEDIAAHSFHLVVADPPYLSEECLRKTSETIKYLTQGKILLCTGAVMEEEAAKLLGVRMCKFIPKHTRTLANEFRCYVNYDSGLDHDV